MTKRPLGLESSPRFASKRKKGSSWITVTTLPDHLSTNHYFSSSNTTVLKLTIPRNFSLSQAVCSYGYFCLAPNRWVPSSSDDDDEGYLVRPLRYQEGLNSTLVSIGQDTDRTDPAVIVAFRADVLEPKHHAELVEQVTRMLRLEMDLMGFHDLHSQAKHRRFGRLYRSPTLFEDMVKTITNCNMKWSGTVEMNAKLCRHVGKNGAFPTALEIHRLSPAFLKERCRLGYRSEWVWQLATEVVEGRLDLQELESMNSREEVQKRLLQIKGIGSFASNNILQLMGYFESFPYDTETVRLWKEAFGASKSATKQKTIR